MWPRTSIEGRWRRFAFYDVPVLVYAGVIFWLSSQTHTAREKQWLNLVPDTLLHGVEYGFLALLLLRQLYGSGRMRSLIGAALLSLLISVAYGVSDEWHQSFVPDRQMDLRDGVANGVGAFLFLALTLVYLLTKKELTLPKGHDNL